MTTIHIDVDPAEIGKNIQPELPLVGNAKVILQQLMEKEISVDSEAWVTSLQERRSEELRREYPFRTDSVTPGRLLSALGHRLNADAAVCVDVGQNQIWSCKNLWLGGSRFLTSGGLGTMGYSLPAAIGVKTACPDRQTVVVCGDGSFQMEMNELSAVCVKGMDLKIVLIRNGVLGLVNQIQRTAPYHGAFGVSLDGSPDFAAIAAAYGIPSILLENDSQIDGALEQLLSQPGPCLLIANVASDVTTND